MTDYPKVSVVTITYGHENYITQTLDGVLMQDYLGEIEFIIANDCSPDATDRVIKDYLSSRTIPDNFIIKYTKHEFNKGMMPNFIWALERASGKYIALCEGDDYWIDPLKLQKQVDFLEENENFAICFHRAETKYQKGDENKIADINIVTKEISTVSDLVKKNFIHTPTVVFKNQKKYPTWLTKVFPGDYPLHIINATYGKIKFLPEIMATYRVHEGGVHSTKSIRLESSCEFGYYTAKYLHNNHFFEEADIMRKDYLYKYCEIYAIDNSYNLSKFKRTKILLKYGNRFQKYLFFLPIIFGKYSSVIYFKLKS